MATHTLTPRDGPPDYLGNKQLPSPNREGAIGVVPTLLASLQDGGTCGFGLGVLQGPRGRQGASPLEPTSLEEASGRVGEGVGGPTN